MTGDEMQGAIEFLLKNQAKFEVQLEKTDRQLEQANRQVEETSRQVGETNILVSSLAETRAVSIQIVTRRVETQGEVHADTRRAMKELAQAQLRTELEIAELTKTVGGSARIVYKNGGSPQAQAMRLEGSP